MLYFENQVDDFFSHKFSYIIVNKENHLLTITLNRPEKKNAMNPVMMQEIVFALSYAHYSKDVWAVVLAANGDTFCAGADLKAFAGQASEVTDSTIPAPTGEILLGEVFNLVHKPVIARVHANVYAGGFLLVCGCTYVVTADNAKFSLPEVKRGIWPMQVMASLLPLMSKRQLLHLCMQGNTFSAAMALEYGIATQVVKIDELDKTVRSIVDDICSNSPTAIRLGFKALDELRNVSQKEQHAFLKAQLGNVLKTKDAAEGLSAFIEKRAPNWTGE